MKKALGVLLIIALMVPININADQMLKHSDAIEYINTEKNGNKGIISTYYKYRNYLDIRTKQFYCAKVNGNMQCNLMTGYKYGGFLSLDEFRIAGGRYSYLFDGMEYFTMNSDSSNVAYISSNSDGFSWDNKSSKKTYTRLTQYVPVYISVAGSGTYRDPWVFDGEGVPPEWLVDPTIDYHLESGSVKDNGWYITTPVIKVFTNMPEKSFAIFNYCLTTEGSCTPNREITTTSKDITIETNSATNRICAYIETVVGKTAEKCSDIYKVDTVSPTCKVAISGNAFDLTNIVEATSGLADKAYSWTSSSTGFTNNPTTPATNSTTYTAWVKDNAGNVGTCSSMTCTAWTCTPKNTLGTCSTVINNTNKVDNCANRYTCSRTYNYSCPSGTSGSPTSSSPYCYTGTNSSRECDNSGGYWQDDIYHIDPPKKGACKGTWWGSRPRCGNCGGYYSNFCRSGTLYHNGCRCNWISTESCWTNYWCSSGTQINNSQCRHNATSYCPSGYTDISSSCKKYDQTSCASGETSTITSRDYQECTRTCSGE